MELSALFLLLLVVIVIVLFVTRPFMGKLKRDTDKGHELSSLLAEQERILNALQELDFDNLLGKIPAEEYSVQRQDLLGRGATVLRRLDEVQGARAASPEPRLTPAASLRRANLNDDELEDLIAKRRAARKEKTGGFCPRCGKPVLLSDRFCPSCGKPLK